MNKNAEKEEENNGNLFKWQRHLVHRSPPDQRHMHELNNRADSTDKKSSKKSKRSGQNALRKKNQLRKADTPLKALCDIERWKNNNNLHAGKQQFTAGERKKSIE